MPKLRVNTCVQCRREELRILSLNSPEKAKSFIPAMLIIDRFEVHLLIVIHFTDELSQATQILHQYRAVDGYFIVRPIADGSYAVTITFEVLTVSFNPSKHE